MKTLLKWVRRIVMFPIDTVCVLAAVLLIISWVVLFRLPLTAAKEDVPVFDLLVRTCQADTPYPGQPLRDVIHTEPLAEGLIDLELPPGQKVTRSSTTRLGPYEYRQTFTLSDGRTVTTTGTDRSVDVPVGELKRGQEAVAGLFDLSDPVVRRWVVQLGENLLDGATRHHPGGSWMMCYSDDSVYIQFATRPVGREFGPKMEATPPADRPDLFAQEYWAVYRAFRGHQPNAAADLGRLHEMAATAFPDPAERAAVYAWGEQLYDRMVQLSLDANVRFGEQIRSKKLRADLGKELGVELAPEPEPAATLEYLKRNPNFRFPPRCAGTVWWLVYQFIGLDEPSRRAAAEFAKGAFLPERMAAVEACGNERISQRRAAGQRVPPDSPAAPFVALLEYYRGWDDDGMKTWAVYHQLPRSSVVRMGEGLGPVAAYPSDDITFVWVGDDRLHLTDTHSTRGQLWIVCGLLLVANRGLRVLFHLLGDWVLWLRHNKAYQHYRDGRGDPPAWVHWPVLGVVILLSWLVAWSRLDWPLLPVAPSPEWLLLGSAIATVLGGKLIAAIGRLLALLMLRCGINVEKVWYDEILGILLGVVVLHVFGNDWANICVYVLAEVLPAVAGHFYGRWKQRREPAESAADEREPEDGEPDGPDPAPKKGKLLASRPRVARPVASPPVAKPAPPPTVAKPVVRRAKPVDE